MSTAARRARDRRLYLAGSVLLLGALLGASHAPPAHAAPTTHTITIEGMRFSPDTLEVRLGDTVQWVNNDIWPHNATATNRGLESPELASGDSWQFKAERKGSFPYLCTLHPPMKATLIVK